MAEKKEEKSKYEQLAEKVLIRRENSWKAMGKAGEQKAMPFNDDYKAFLDRSKTEREAVITLKKMAESYGYKEYPKSKTKYYIVNRDKNIAFVSLGKGGLNICISHIDSPRLDLKPYPLYEDSDFALFKTHYYGGIKKYQWMSTQLSLHGVIFTKGGKRIDICIGEDPKDPVFTIADLLPHLGKKQSEKPMKEAIEGEQLNILVGNMPVDDKKIEQKFKLRVMGLLNMKYGITEEDFISSEMHAVPAGKARDLGLDRSMVISYGQDDKASTYAAARAFLDSKPRKTSVFLAVDKEEIGSEGATGMQSYFIEELARSISGADPRITLSGAKVLSCDVNSAMNPNFKDVHDAQNANFIGRGPVLAMYTGYGGKYDSSDAGGQYTREVIDLFNKNKIPWQAGELGKVDEGGGGTISKYMAKYNCDIIDYGPAVLGMHGPMEVTSKIDMYSTYLGCRAFYEEM